MPRAKRLNIMKRGRLARAKSYLARRASGGRQAIRTPKQNRTFKGSRGR